jgi:hypothetical protein
MQGEQEAMGSAPYSAWQSSWTTFVPAMRAAVSLPNLPALLVKVPTNYPSNTTLAQLRAAQDAFVVSDGKTTPIEFATLPGYVDAYHYDVGGIETISSQVAALV